MSEMNIKCPHCGELFELNEALTAPLLESERKRSEAEVARRVETERAVIEKKAADAVAAEYAAKLSAVQATVAEKDAKLLEAQKAELAVRQDRERLAEERRQVELTVQRRVDDEVKRAAAAAIESVSKDMNAKITAAEARIAEKDAKLAEAQKVELETRQERERLMEEKRQFDLLVRRSVDEQVAVAAAKAAEAATQELSTELAAAQSLAMERDAKLAEVQQRELAALKAKQEAEDAKRETELQVARQLDAERGKIRDEAMRQRDDEYRLKMAEKDQQITAMQQKLEEARRKGDNASQQLTGEVMETDLCDNLAAAFPNDGFERVRKGHAGGDVLQTVKNRLGHVCGKILWESKRTKNWSDSWLAKLRDDQREANADVAALMSETLPDGVHHFELREHVWVTGVPTVVGLAAALRQGLIETANARRAAAGTDSAKDHAYTYLTGPTFRQRVRGALEPISQMREDHELEKRMTLKRWGTREKQLDRFMSAMLGMYGDLQGLVGPALPDVEGLMLPEPEEAAEKPKLTVVNSDLPPAPSASDET
jgi:hypothetical protein